METLIGGGPCAVHTLTMSKSCPGLCSKSAYDFWILVHKAFHSNKPTGALPPLVALPFCHRILC